MVNPLEHYVFVYLSSLKILLQICLLSRVKRDGYVQDDEWRVGKYWYFGGGVRCLAKLRKTMYNLRQDSRYLSRVLNQVPTEHKSTAPSVCS